MDKKTQNKYDIVDLCLIGILRNNARIELRPLSAAIGIDESVLNKKIREYKEDGIIKRYTGIIDFEWLGYHTRVVMFLSTSAGDRDKLINILKRSDYVNSLFTVNNDEDIIAEAVFTDEETAEWFMKRIEEQVALKHKQVLHIQKEIKREAFLPIDKLLQAHAAAHAYKPS